MEQYVGLRIRDRRLALGRTQDEFGREIGRWTGKTWSRSTVSMAETGKRLFTAGELVAIAFVLQTTTSYLLTPPAEAADVTLPSGAALPREVLFTVTPQAGDDSNFAAIEQALARLMQRAARTEREAAELVTLAQDLDLLVTRKVILGPPPPGTDPQELYSQPLFTEQPDEYHEGEDDGAEED